MGLTSLLLLASCKPEDMRSTNSGTLGEQSSRPSGGSSQGNTSSDDQGKEDFQTAIDEGLDTVVDEAVTPQPECAPPTDNSASPTQDQTSIDQIINIAFREDPTCKTVFTGNKGDYQSTDISYARVMAYSMARDMCNDENFVKLMNEKSLSSEDALDQAAFKNTSSVNNLAATYALMYSLGQRSSNGNFYQEKDPYSKSTGIEEESGLTQTSSNSLNLDGSTEDSKNLLRDIFTSTISSLANFSNPKDRADYCLVDKLKDSTQTKTYNSSTKKYESAQYDIEGTQLNELFSDNGACQELVSIVKNDYRVYSKDALAKINDNQERDQKEKETVRITNCFLRLHNHCPGFSIRYGAAVTRINRKHNSPLRTEKQSKPAPKPACHKLFNSIMTSKPQICNEMPKLEATNRPANPNGDPSTDITTPNSPPTGTVAGSSGGTDLGPGPGAGIVAGAGAGAGADSETGRDGNAQAPQQQPKPTPTPPVEQKPADLVVRTDKPAANADAYQTGEYINVTDMNGIKLIIPKGVDLKLLSTTSDRSTLVLINGVKYKVSNSELRRIDKTGMVEKFLKANGAPEEKKDDGTLRIISRATWDRGYDSRSMARKMGRMSPPVHVTLHNSAGVPNTNDDSEVKGIKRLHTNTNKWSDIGYHYVIPRNAVSTGGYSGDVYEAREIKFTGAHAGGGNNRANIGIVLLGNFHPFNARYNPAGARSGTPEPTAYQRDTLKKLIRSLKARYPRLTKLRAHRSYKSTSCPGDKAMPLINEINNSEY